MERTPAWDKRSRLLFLLKTGRSTWVAPRSSSYSKRDYGHCLVDPSCSAAGVSRRWRYRSCAGTDQKEVTKMLRTSGSYHRRDRLEPAVTRLAYAVLVQAIRDIRSKDQSKQAGDWREDALEWLWSKEHGVGSFAWVCLVLQWDPEKARAAIVGMPDENPPRYPRGNGDGRRRRRKRRAS